MCAWQYAASSGEERVFLERKYGRRQLETMATVLASEDYVSSHARTCPHCNAPIEKNEGCNKVRNTVLTTGFVCT